MTTVVLAVVLAVALLLAGRLVADLRPVPRGARPGGRPIGRSGVSVVVPARNEAATIGTLLGSLRHLATAPAEVVVVDDGSEDTTGAVARQAGATVVELAGPPPGWTGKAWACQAGADATTGDLLVFLDADTALEPDALDGLLEVHRRHGGLVSVQPFHEVRRPYEQLSAYFNVASLMASAAFGPRPARRPMAFGPCLVTSRADYERAGGHAAVREEILDDVQLAVAYGRAGLPVRCLVGGPAMRMRMYPGGVRQLAEGWTKNIASGASAAEPRATTAVVAWVAAHHAVAVGAALALVEAVGGPTGVPAAGHPALWAVAWVAVAAQLRAVLRRIGSFRWWAWALFPVPLLAFDLLFARSAARTLLRRSVRWRGRDVAVSAGRPVGEDA